jgi:hypothetical protein
MSKSNQKESRPSRQSSEESPIIEDPRLPKMDEHSNRPKRIRGKIMRMPLNPSPSKGGKKLMDAVPVDIEGQEGTFESTEIEYGKQEERKVGTKKESSRQEGEGYLRLHLRVQDGQMSLLEVRKVDGPLLMENEIDSKLVYEAALPSKRIALGSIIDVGVNRSYPNPEGVPGQEGHFFIDLPSFEFDARIPAKGLSSRDLPKVEIAVYRVKGPVRKTAGEKSLAVDLGNELREVARLKGISLKSLPQKSQTEIRKILK